MSVPFINAHQKGELKLDEIKDHLKELSIDTYAGKIQVSFDEESDMTTSGQMIFFVAYLKLSGIWDKFVEECPIIYTSHNAPNIRDILGTILLSVLSGHKRYAHITAIRSDNVNPNLLGMTKVMSADAVRRALENVDVAEGVKWLEDNLHYSYAPILIEPWILDVDTSIKQLYGKQEGAVLGYNPKKPGRPSHVYHTYMIGVLRLILNVEVLSGNESATSHTAPELWKLLDSLDKNQQPKLLRADCAFGNDAIISGAEARGLDYLFKLKITNNVKKAIIKVANKQGWSEAGQGWSGIKSEIQLIGWHKSRKIIILRKLTTKPITALEESKVKLLKHAAVTGADTRGYQLELPFFDCVKGDFRDYEYAVLVTSLDEEISAIAQLYRDRADSENGFDELKNQWGWGGYVTQDLKRCRFMARIVALVYNWWNLFARLADPEKHMEAISSRPMLLHAVGKQTQHSGQTYLKICSLHGLKRKVLCCFTRVTKILEEAALYAKQLTKPEVWRFILRKALTVFLDCKDVELKLNYCNTT
jgi:hypothetical protein